MLTLIFCKHLDVNLISITDVVAAIVCAALIIFNHSNILI